MSKKHYVKSKEFIAEYKKSEEIDEPTEKMMNIFYRIAVQYSTIFGKNVNKLDQDACINYALYEAWRKWKKYDETRSKNIFAFFTEVIKNDLTAHYNTINKNKHRFVSIDALLNSTNNK